jgi:hypothetical protein
MVIATSGTYPWLFVTQILRKKVIVSMVHRNYNPETQTILGNKSRTTTSSTDSL